MLDARTRKRWNLAAPASEDAVRALAGPLRLHPLVARLLIARDVTTPAEADAFLKPRLNHLTDPALLPGVRRAARRIAQAIADQQPIVIYGDYDVDGITASSILYHAITACGGRASTYVPHRLDEGYGLNEEAIRTLCGDDPACRPLIISVDCGITAVGPASVARDLATDLIITDHHTFDPAALPDAYALVHPGLSAASDDADARPADADPSQVERLRHLAGAGVAFKLAWQVLREHAGSDRLPESLRELIIDLLSLAALGTIADVVPLIGENRILASFGLRRIKQTRFIGLNALIDAAHLRDEKVDAYHVGFVLGPRLNACGRMGHAARAVHLLTKADAAEAMETALFLTHENERRRETERAIADDARAMVVANGYDHDDCRAIVVASEGWHQGVVGIVASRLVETFCRPAIVLNIDDGVAHGSARSVDGFSIHDALCACADHLDRFGGHAAAAGLGLPASSIDAFRDALVAYANDHLTPDDLTHTLAIDGEVSLADCTIDLFAQLHALEPFGRANAAPLLLIRNLLLDRPAQRIGRAGNHLSLFLRQDGRVMRAVAFGLGDRADELPAGVAIDAVFEPKLTTWQGQRRAELHIKDFRPGG